MRKATLLLSSVILSCMLTFSSQAAYYCTNPESEGAVRVDGTWTTTDQGRQFVGADGQIYANHWLYAKNGSWYYFDQNGYAVTGIQTVEGKVRGFNKQYGYLRRGYFVLDGALYYGDINTGELITSKNGGNDGQHERDGVVYFFGEDGRAMPLGGQWDPTTYKEIAMELSGGTTWKREKAYDWFYYSNGEKIKNRWLEDGGYRFYFDETGLQARNCVKEINGVTYKFTNNGTLQTSGNVHDNGNSYVANSDGTLTLTKSKEEKDAEKAMKEYLNSDYALNERLQNINNTYNPYINNEVVQWFNATYAILTKGNDKNIKAVGGQVVMGADGTNSAYATYLKRALVSWWGVTDRASADRVLTSLVARGLATGSAWDYSRAMSNLGYYYIAGYYTIEETLNKSLEIAQAIQSSFNSWDEFNESYFKGYTLWSGESDTERREIMNKLKTSRFNPYAVDWNLKLEKTW